MPASAPGWEIGTSAMRPSVVKVRASRRETPDVVTLELQPPTQGWGFRPGQFNMVYAFGVGEAAISLSGDPAQDNAVIHTIRTVGSVTQALGRLNPGDAVGVRGPFGSAWPVETAQGHDVVIVGGGIGMAVLRPVIYHLRLNRGQYGRIVVLVGARTAEDFLYRNELEKWRSESDIQVLMTVDRGDPAWHGSVGLVTTLVARAEFDPKQAFGLLCGPEVMMRFAQRELENRGISDDRIYLSLERNMQCAIGFCGHCQLGPEFVCRDGPTFRYDRIKRFFNVPEA